MDFIVKNTTLAELATLCYRIGEPGLQEAINEEKIDDLQKYLDEGLSLREAVQKWEHERDKEAQQYLENALKDQDKTKVQVKADKKPIEDTSTDDLHLDGPPENEDVPWVTRQDVVNLALGLAKRGDGDALKRILTDYKVTKIIDITDNDLPEVYEKLKEVS